MIKIYPRTPFRYSPLHVLRGQSFQLLRLIEPAVTIVVVSRSSAVAFPAVDSCAQTVSPHRQRAADGRQHHVHVSGTRPQRDFGARPEATYFEASPDRSISLDDILFRLTLAVPAFGALCQDGSHLVLT